MEKKIILFISIVAFIKINAEQTYNNYKLYNVIPDQYNIDYLLKWAEKDGVELWTHAGAGRNTQTVVAPGLVYDFLLFMKAYNFTYTTKIENMSDSIKELNTKHKKFIDDYKPFYAERNFQSYWQYSDMLLFEESITERNPNLIKRQVIGKSSEGRNIIAYRISRNFDNVPIIMIVAGLDAREWSSHMSAYYFITQLVENRTISLDLLYDVEYVIIPNANPDGYVHSFMYDRLWRKNRHLINDNCIGVYLNSNFNYMWGMSDRCYRVDYSGPYANSELETQAISKLIANVSATGRFEMYLTLQGSGGYLVYPFAYDIGKQIPNWEEHIKMGSIWNNAVNSTGINAHKYEIGNADQLKFMAKGTSEDFAAGAGKARYVFSIQLPESGIFGFDYPINELNDLYQEIFSGISAFEKYIIKQKTALP